MSVRRGKRIAFCGAGGTGKTTSAKFISEEFELPLVKSASRTIYARKDLDEPTVNKMSPEKLLALQKDIFDLKVDQDRQFSYVADRTILDHYAYCLAYCGAFMNEEQFTEFDELTQALMLSSYSHVFYFPWGYWKSKSDGVRHDSSGWQSQIDSIILGHLHRWNVYAVVVPQAEGEDVRNEFIKKVIIGEEF